MEEGVTLDEASFKKEIEKQRERGRANVVSAFVNFNLINSGEFSPTEFVGYHSFSSVSKVLGVADSGKESLVITDVSPFYPSSGGQIGDIGTIESDKSKFEVSNTEKVDQVTIHKGKWHGKPFSIGEEVRMKVDSETRNAIMRNHTATHILHKVLQDLLGSHVKQAGSLVAPDRLRFDFGHFGPISPECLAQIERRVNEIILEDFGVQVFETNYQEALNRGAMALFSEKYGDKVRLVEIGDGYSKELCGGTHLSNTGKVGFFSILTESSIASGIRRIEAITGKPAIDRFQNLVHNVNQWGTRLECSPNDISEKLEKLLLENQALKRTNETFRKNERRALVERANRERKKFGMTELIINRFDGTTVEELKEIVDEIVDKKENILALLASSGEKVNFVLKISPDLVNKGFNAGKLVKEISQITGGGGGGRPDLATAGGKEISKLEQALTFAESLIGKKLEKIDP
ncbi:hypothetical protein HYY75_11680 [bacterium]|nr:hypothetical protein [bacterium]